jgi:predicted transcriptional regulator
MLNAIKRYVAGNTIFSVGYQKKFQRIIIHLHPAIIIDAGCK